MKRSCLFCSLTLLTLLFTRSLAAADLIRWEADIEAARQVAAAEKKLLLIHFWAPDCAPCKVVEQAVFPTPSVAQTVHENFVPLKVNAYERADLRLQYQVDRWPTDVIATPDGQIVHRMVTPQEPRQYVNQLTAIAMTKAPRSATPSRWATGPQVDAEFLDGPRRPGGMSQLGNDVTSFAGTQSNFSEGGFAASMPSSQGLSSRVADSTTDLGGEIDRRAAEPGPRAITNHYAEGPSAGFGTTTNSRNAVGNPYVTSPPRSAPMDAVTSAQQHSSPPPNSSYTGGEQTRAGVPQTPMNPPLGLDGRCPVTLARDRVWQKGDPRWGAIHRGKTYLFTGPEEQTLFLSDPDLYSPVLAGMDIVKLAEEGRIVEGSRRFGVVFDEDGQGPNPSRVYLFDSADSRNRFEQVPDQYLRPVLQAMQHGTLDTLLR